MNDTSSINASIGGSQAAKKAIPWKPWLAVLFVIVTYYVSQIIAAVLLSVYPLLRHWTQNQASDWLQHAIGAQFFYVLVAEGLTMLALWWFLRLFKRGWKVIGFRRPKWRDLFTGLAIAPLYYLSYIITVALAQALIPSLNIDQAQQLGFNNPIGAGQLVMVFVSLVILPPLVEETLMRGYLYGSLKAYTPKLAATLVTSFIFASAHLEFGSGGPLVWIAAIDTFILSLFLIWLRERTGSLWAGMVLHGLKNAIAFASLYLFHLS